MTRHYHTKKEKLKEEELKMKEREYWRDRAIVKQQLLAVLKELEEYAKD
jgi:hypothetical protein